MSARFPIRPGSDDGFTLIEMLVAIVAGLVVTGALLSIIDFSARQETRISDRVQADRTGRLSLERVLDELRSSCVGNATPIQKPKGTPVSPLATTNASNLWLISTYGTTTSGAGSPKEGYEHDINWTATGTSNTGVQLGTITDYAFKSESGEPPASEWKFPATLSTTSATSKRVLAKNVTPTEAALFRYYHYDTTATSPTYGELRPLTSSELPLASEEAAARIAQVSVSYQQAPENGDTRTGHTTSVTSSVSLRLSPTETPAEGSPCE
jgi:prepilin-type N-terminal cleavage/methylation domain-containing protein